MIDSPTVDVKGKNFPALKARAKLGLANLVLRSESVCNWSNMINAFCDMNPFAKDCSELIFLSNSFCLGVRPLITIDELISRLKDFCETHRDNSDKNALQLKLRLLTNLMFIVRSAKKNDEKCLVLNCMTRVLKMTVVDDVEFFTCLYNTVFYQIYPEQNASLSEEIKLAVLECSIELIKRSTKRLLQLLYNEEYGAKFSMGVLIAVQIAKEERSFKLRITALDFLLLAMQHHKQNDKVLQNAVGDLFMLYLPGVLGRLQDIILRDETQHHLITLKAISCWGQLLCVVMQNADDEEEILVDGEQVKMWMNLSEEASRGIQKSLDVKKALQEKRRSKNWLEAASQTIRPLILKITDVRKHSHPKVRLQLVTEINRLLANCLTSLKSSIIPMIDILISSSEDDDEEVREVADLAIARFENSCRCKNGQIYLNFIEESLNSVLIKMPNILHLGDDKSILNGMSSLCGVLKILQNSGKLEEVTSFPSNLFRLVRVLTVSSKLELYPEISAQDYSALDSDANPVDVTKSWKRFKHFADGAIYCKLLEICGVLGKCGELESILDHLFDKFREDYSTRNETLFLINEIIGSARDLQDNVAKHFLDLYLDPELLFPALKVDDDRCANVKELHSNIVSVALLMEGQGKLANALGKRYENFLFKTLYFVVEKMGSSYLIIRNSATTAANEISKAVGLEGNVTSLIQTNFDYLNYHIMVKLRRDHPGVLDVVRVLMRNSPFEAMSYLEEIINNVLKSSFDKFASPLSHLRLFQTFVICVNKWQQESAAKTENTLETADKTSKTESIVDKLVTFIDESNKRKAESEDTDMEDKSNENVDENQGIDDEDDDDANPYEVEQAKNLPKHVRLTLAVAENALNYLPSKDFERKLVVLEILNESVSILADRENELLPLVHKIWSPLVVGFDASVEPIIINRSFTLLYNLSRTSKDFIRRRTLKNVLPTLREFLHKSADKSRLKDSGSGFYFTQTFKLQRELLSKLASLTTDIRLAGKELDCIVECALPYLSTRQPLALQENCIKLFSELKELDPYIVWYKLHKLKDESEFAKNSQIILDYVFCNKPIAGNP